MQIVGWSQSEGHAKKHHLSRTVPRETGAIRLPEVLIKSAVVHTVSYFMMGLVGLFVLNYAVRFAQPPMDVFMRPIDHPLVAAGPPFQPLRGALFGVVFFLFRDRFFGKSDGWLVSWAMLVIVGILSTFGPSPGSIEGMIYTTLPFADHFPGWIEVMPQAFLVAYGTYFWVRNPDKRWLSWVLGIPFAIMVAVSVLGLVFGGQVFGSLTGVIHPLYK